MHEVSACAVNSLRLCHVLVSVLFEYLSYEHGRRFVLKFGGDDERGAFAPAHGHRPYVLGVGARGGRPLPPQGSGGITPGNF